MNELNTTSNRNNKKYLEGYEILGTIEIPKTKLKCTILSEVTKRSIEIGVGKNPLPISQLYPIYNKIYKMLLSSLLI